MRIDHLKFKNINSLKGEWNISFNDSQLSNAGIFAITGPTGSGKSTLLDVITLALFNRIPRFKKAISKNEMQGLGSVITHHAKDAMAELGFSVNGLNYISRWNVARTKAGKLKDYHMEIIDPSGNILDLKKSEVPNKNEEIIGLKYDQFIKSILLSQGEFTKFLKADKNERGLLLENITGTSIYRKLGIVAYQKAKEAKDKKERSTEILGLIEPLSKEERKTIEDQVKEKEKLKEEMQNSLKLSNENFLNHKKILELKSNLVIKEEALTKIKQQWEDLSSEKENFDLYNRLTPIRGELALLKDNNSGASYLEKAIVEQKENLKFAQAELNNSIEEMSKLTDKKVNEDNFLETMSLFESEVKQLKQDLKVLTDKGKDLRSRINNKKNDSGIEISEKASANEAIETLKFHHQKLQKILKDGKIDENKKLEDLLSKSNILKTEQDDLLKLQHHYEHLDELDSKQKNIAEALIQKKKILDTVQPIIDKNSNLLDELRKHLTTLEKRKEDAIKIVQLETYRSKLEDGAPCPLCGSLDHPYSEHDLDNKQDAIEIEINNQKVKIKNIEEEQKIKEHEKSTELASVNIYLEEEKKIKILQKEEQVKITSQSEKYKGKYNLLKSELNTNISKISIEIQGIEKSTTALSQIKVTKELIEEFKTLDKVLSDYHKTNKILNAKYSGEDVSKECNHLQNIFNKALSKKTTAEAKGSRDQAELQKLLKSILKIESSLLPQLETLGFKDSKEAMSQLISDERAQSISVQLEKLKADETSINTELKNLQSELELTAKKVDNKTSDIEELKSQHRLNEEKQQEILKDLGKILQQIEKDNADKKAFESKQKEIKQLEKEWKKWGTMAALIGDKTGNKFSNFAQGLTLKNLLVYANRRLENLSDRYLLDMPTEDGELMVVDQYQGNIQRAVSTLSGGESFLISLALALSLSDMASKNVRLNSLFIDEGFGTLDQDTLDIALDTLDKLQSESQKTVGVISHVEALKERIPVQIKLNKNPQGYSTIKIVEE